MKNTCDMEHILYDAVDLAHMFVRGEFVGNMVAFNGWAVIISLM